MKINFEIDRLNLYNKNIHHSKKISYKPNNLAIINTVINSFNILISVVCTSRRSIEIENKHFTSITC